MITFVKEHTFNGDIHRRTDLVITLVVVSKAVCYQYHEHIKCQFTCLLHPILTLVNFKTVEMEMHVMLCIRSTTLAIIDIIIIG